MSHGPAGGPAGAVVVVHGGRSVSSEPTTAVQPSVLRMIPVARAIRRGVRGTGVVVYRTRLRLRGWTARLTARPLEAAIRA